MRIRYTLAILVVAASCSSGPGGAGTPGDGGKGGGAGQAPAGSGGHPSGGDTGGTTGSAGAAAGSGGGGSAGAGQAPAGSGGHPSGGDTGGTTGSAGAAAGSGGGGSAGGATAGSGSAGTAGTGGHAGGGGTTGAELIGPPRSTDPWPESCVSGALDRPAGSAYLTGPYAGSGLGSPPMPGESVTAKLNGLARSFSTSLTVGPVGDGATPRLSVRAYGNDGFIDLTVPEGGPGSYMCPNAFLAYANLKAGWEGNVFRATDCCRLEITKAGGPGETVEGTFSGILNSGIHTWLEAEEGSFKVVRRTGTGGFAGTGG